MSIEQINVLLVEDNPGDARLIQEMLNESNSSDFNFKNCERLAEGIEILNEGWPKIVLLDLSLPDSKGLETFYKVRDLVLNIPIIVLTGFDDDNLAAIAVREGAQDYLTKGGIDSELLKRSIYYAIERNKSEETLRISNRILEISNRENDIQTILKEFIKEILSFSEADAGCVFLPNIENDSSSPHFFLTGFENDHGQKIMDLMKQKGKPEFTLIKTFMQKYFYSVVAIPLNKEDAIMGTIYIAVKKENSISDTIIGLLEKVSLNISMAIQRVAAEERLKRLNKKFLDANNKLKKTQSRMVQSERLAAVGQLGAGVAHEINNPSAFVYSNLGTLKQYMETMEKYYVRAKEIMLKSASHDISNQFLNEEEQDEISFLWNDSKDLIDESVEGMTRIKDIVRDLRTFSELSEDNLEEIDINELLEKMLNMVGNQISYKAKLIKNYSEIPVICGNGGKLGQAFLNMLINSIQSLPEDDKENKFIKVSTMVKDGWIKVIVEDTGCGIKPEDMPRIFDPFFTARPIGEGKGLGLAITHEVIKLHGGNIEVNSQPGKGTTFDVSLPVSNVERKVEEKERPDTSKKPVPTARILLVDDEELILKAYTRAIPDKYEVEVANSGQEALEIITSGKNFDVVLCDIMMPDLSGDMLFEKVVEINQELAEKFIFVTGGTFTKRTKEFERNNKQICLEKPLKAGDLVSAINNILNKNLGPGSCDA
jgi:signal transduction histidine kinase/DNA-binding response OmpR family regulator